VDDVITTFQSYQREDGDIAVKLQDARTLANRHLENETYEEADKLLLALRYNQQKLLGKNHKGTLETSYDLTRSLYGQGKYQEAERLSGEVLGTETRVLEKDNNATLMTAHYIGPSLYEQEKYQ
jgi:hypothetical protein